MNISPYELSRQVLPHVLNARGLTGSGVEVGVCKGEFSECILNTWKGHLYLVDPWTDMSDYTEQYDHDSNLAETIERLKSFKNYEIVRKTSLQAADDFADESLDFVYLDANHTYDAVLEDLNAWYPKIKIGGLFAGDDYGPVPEQHVDFGKGRHVFGVKRAVDEFCFRVGKNPSIDWLAQWWVTDKDGQSWPARNWWFIK